MTTTQSDLVLLASATRAYLDTHAALGAYAPGQHVPHTLVFAAGYARDVLERRLRRAEAGEPLDDIAHLRAYAGTEYQRGVVAALDRALTDIRTAAGDVAVDIRFAALVQTVQAIFNDQRAAVAGGAGDIGAPRAVSCNDCDARGLSGAAECADCRAKTGIPPAPPAGDSTSLWKEVAVRIVDSKEVVAAT